MTPATLLAWHRNPAAAKYDRRQDLDHQIRRQFGQQALATGLHEYLISLHSSA